MTFAEFKYLVKSDCFREYGSSSWKTFLTRFRYCPGARYTFYYRLTKFADSNRACRFLFRRIAYLLLHLAEARAGIHVHSDAKIGPGLLFVHYGGIWISGLAKIGANCTICQSVTIGGISDGPGKGAPTIGDNVYVGPGAVVSGEIHIGNNALIGANSLIVSDVPDHGVVFGVPGKLFSKNGSSHFVHHIDYRNYENSSES
ncbi:MAG: serine acetyltransferase [Verrucomicrobiae bacterium]|nr:serine acetyltransferase [Verrucomicrobiae bacterium]